MRDATGMQFAGQGLQQAEVASPPHYFVTADPLVRAPLDSHDQRPNPQIRVGTEQIGTQPGCSAFSDRDAALGRYPRPRPETLLGWLERLDRSSGCWIWPGGLSGGYGHVTYRVGGEKVDAKLHVLLYEIFVGPVADGLLLDHRCRRRPCCNPECLEPVTNQVNVIRGVHGRRREEAIEAGQIELAVAA